MKIENLKEALATFNEPLDLKLTTFKMNENLSIQLDHVNLNEWEEPKDIKGEVYFFEATFYGKHYSFQLYRKHLERNSNIVLCEGVAELFDSFENAIEEDYWQQIVLIAKRYIQLTIKEAEEYQ